MIRPEDQLILEPPVRIPKPPRSSAVSQLLRALADEPSESPAAWDSDEYRLRVASDRSSRERAYQLAYRVYRQKGYVPADTNELIVSATDALPETLTVLVEDANGREAGTISQVFDSESALPCDEIYGPETDGLRSQGRRLVEVTRLAIDEAHAHSKTLLTLLCNVPFAYGWRVAGCSDLVIEVNPRHVAYYVRLMKFEVLGQERACPRVDGAPAVLLRADLEQYDSEMQRIGGMGAACAERSLFPHFLSGVREYKFARFLACRHKPMTPEDAQYFGLQPKPVAMRKTQVV
jgi:hypothetical protein